MKTKTTDTSNSQSLDDLIIRSVCEKTLAEYIEETYGGMKLPTRPTSLRKFAAEYGDRGPSVRTTLSSREWGCMTVTLNRDALQHWCGGCGQYEVLPYAAMLALQLANLSAVDEGGENFLAVRLVFRDYQIVERTTAWAAVDREQ